MWLDYAGLYKGGANQEAGVMVQLSHCLNQLDKLSGDHSSRQAHCGHPSILPKTSGTRSSVLHAWPQLELDTDL